MSKGAGVSGGSEPDRWREAAQLAFRARLPRVPVADLTFDSLLDAEEGRHESRFGIRELRFSAGSDYLHVTVRRRGEGVLIELFLEPPRAGRVTLRSLADQRSLVVHPGRPVRLEAASDIYSFLLEDDEGRALLQTAWVRF